MLLNVTPSPNQALLICALHRHHHNAFFCVCCNSFHFLSDQPRVSLDHIAQYPLSALLNTLVYASLFLKGLGEASTDEGSGTMTSPNKSGKGGSSVNEKQMFKAYDAMKKGITAKHKSIDDVGS